MQTKHFEALLKSGLFFLFFVSLNALIWPACPSGALAEEGDGQKELLQSEKESSGETIEVVVTASRGAGQNPLQVPQTINSISQDDIAGFQFTDLDEAVRHLPNVNLGPAGSTPSYWQEGFTIRGLGAQRVLVLSDGIRQTGQGIGYGGGNLSLYDLYGIERIEVLKGPGSVLYGTDAFGGVINLISRNPKRRSAFGLNGGARYSWDQARNMNVGGGYLDFGNQYLGAVIGGSYTAAGDPRLPDNEDPLGGSFQSGSLWGKADYFFSADEKLRFIFNSTRNDDISIYDSSLTLPIAVFPPPGSSIPITSPFRMDIPDYRRTMSGLELSSQKLSKNFEFFKSGIYWQLIRRKFHRQTAFYPQFGPGFAGPPLFFDPSATVATADSRTDDRTSTFEWQTQARFDLGNHKLTSGWDIGLDTTKLPEMETQQVIAAAGIGPFIRPPTSRQFIRARASQTRFGFYTQDNWNLAPFEIVPGARFDYFAVHDRKENVTTSSSGFSGSLGGVYHRTAEHALYLNLASGFRAPDLGERFQDGIVNLGAPSRVIGRSNLSPERAYTAELGTKVLNSRVALDLAGFFTNIQDYIGTTALGIVDGFATNQYNNIGEVNLYGIEASLDYHPLDNLQFYFYPGRTWTNATNKVDVPEWVFNYGLFYTQPIHNGIMRSIKTGLAFRTVSDWVDNTAQSFGRGFFEPTFHNGFTVVNWQANIDLGRSRWGQWTLTGGVKNLFNARYREPFFTLLQPGRGVFLALQWLF